MLDTFFYLGDEDQDNIRCDRESSSGLNAYFSPSWSAKNSGSGVHISITSDKNLLASTRVAGKTYMASIATWFYTHVCGSD